MLTGVFWNIGKREKNEDSIALEQIASIKGEITFAIVCDGIGGLPEGEYASGKMTELAVSWFYEEAVPILLKSILKRKKKIYKSACRLLYQVGKEINAYGLQKGIQLGTTCTMVIIMKHMYMLFHIGDSRAYFISKRNCKQLTRDQILTNGALEQCVGSFSFHKPYFKGSIFVGQKGFLLCTDGFYHRIEEKKIMDILSPCRIENSRQIKKRLRELGEFLIRKGEKDNLSAIYIITGEKIGHE